jgi:signal transduction histidine kinase
MNFFEQIFSLLTTTPGNLIYHLALMFSITGTLYSAIAQWRSTGYPQVKRMLTGLFLLLGGQVVLFVASGLVWQRLIPGDVLLPPLDHAIMFFSLVWVVWIWTFPEPSKSGDTASILLSLLTLTGLIFGVVSRNTGEVPGPFNSTMQYLVWEGASIIILAMGGIALFTRRPQGWSNGLVMAILLFVGHVLELALPTGENNYSGIVRLVSMAAYPILLTLPARFPTPTDGLKTRTVEVYKANVTEHMKSPDHLSSPVRERRRYSTDPKTLQTLLTLAAEVDSTKINQHISRAVAQAMLSDLCFLISIGDDKNSLYIAGGYDLIREENLEGGQINKESMPMLSGAILRGRPLRLPASTTSSDLQGLGDMLGLSNPGNLLNVPIISEKGNIGSILLLSPYSNRLWNADDQTFLATIAVNFSPIIERGRKISEFENSRNQARISAEDAYASLARIQTANNELVKQMEQMKAEAAQVAEASARQKEWLQQIETLKQENEKLNQKLAGLQESKGGDANYQYLENELRLTLQEVAYLQNSLAEANMKILELKKRPTGALGSDKAEVVASLAQELRQPMSSVIGYTDLLLGESVGILGALQRKFVERIKTSTERIGNLIDDLIQITTMESGLQSLKSEEVDLNLIIDNAMAYTSSQLREKNITLRIDLPEVMHPIQADREALQQILIHLLQNAGAASPVDGTISLRVRTRREEGQDYVVLQVTDSGGGIKSEDLPQVFARRYRAENSLIQGVGDTGVGLSIAKSLCEAQGGRIHVETEMGYGSTLSVIMPFKQPIAE